MKTMLFIILLLTNSHARPPQEAFTACVSLSVGDSCSVQTPKGRLPGVCLMPKGKLLCVPNNRRRNTRVGLQKKDINKENIAQPRTRQHTITQTRGVLTLAPAHSSIGIKSEVSIKITGNNKIIRANGIPSHNTGTFPNKGNPHSIKSQHYNVTVPAYPTLSGHITELGMNNFGIAVNGVVFDPNAAEWYLGKRNSMWRYEALSGAVPLGVDENYAHVQSIGAYHYHGLPTLLMQQLNVNSAKHSPIIGWAADGFPIYALYGENGKQMSSSYRLKKGQRPGVGNYPGGRYDGSFVADYEYVAGSGDLDECGGKIITTEDFPQSSYAYFLTAKFPVIPRCFKGNVGSDFSHKKGR